MGNRSSIKTTIEQAVRYWSKHIDESDLSVDWEEADHVCWRCGCSRNLQRCHIVPDSLGGEDRPENIVLLCARCHADGPNVADADIMWDWIKAYKVTFYDTFWNIMGRKEYEFIYGKNIIKEFEELFERAGIIEDEEKIHNLMEK